MTKDIAGLLELFDEMSEEFNDFSNSVPDEDDVLELTYDGDYTEDEKSQLVYCIDDCNSVLADLDDVKKSIEEYVRFLKGELNRK